MINKTTNESVMISRISPMEALDNLFLGGFEFCISLFLDYDNKVKGLKLFLS